MSTEPTASRRPEGDELRDTGRVSRLLPIEIRGATLVYDARQPRPPAFAFRHDQEKGLFVLTWADGRAEKFRDKPARQLVVEADPEAGELRPVVKNGLPIFLYLCREERELG